MTKPRSKQTDAPAGVHPDDVWRPGEQARMKRRLLHLLLMRDPPEVREAFLRGRAPEPAAKATSDDFAMDILKQSF